MAQIPKLIVQLGEMGLAAERMRVERWVALPRTRRRSIHASRNLYRAPAASLRDRLRRPWTEPVCRQVGSSRVRGRDLDRQQRGRCPSADPVAVMTTGARRGLASSTTGGDVSRVEAAPLAVAWRVRTQCRALRWQLRKGAEGCGNCRSMSCSVNPICKPDAAGQLETGET